MGVREESRCSQVLPREGKALFTKMRKAKEGAGFRESQDLI